MGLLDTAPKGSVEKVKTIAESIPGVINCHDVRIRSSGPQLFLDVHILTDGNQTLKRAHKLTEVVEAAIRQEFPEADVIVHPEPAGKESR